MAAELPPPDAAKYVLRELDPLASEFYRRLARAELATTACPACGQASFPPRPSCGHCGREHEWVELPRTGTLYAFTTQERALRFGAPAVLALAEFANVTLPGICEASYDELSIGQAVRAEIRAEPETGLALLAFVPSDAELTDR